MWNVTKTELESFSNRIILWRRIPIKRNECIIATWNPIKIEFALWIGANCTQKIPVATSNNKILNQSFTVNKMWLFQIKFLDFNWLHTMREGWSFGCGTRLEKCERLITIKKKLDIGDGIPVCCVVSNTTAHVISFTIPATQSSNQIEFDTVKWIELQHYQTRERDMVKKNEKYLQRAEALSLPHYPTWVSISSNSNQIKIFN
jgi:hypothetical protein